MRSTDQGSCDETLSVTLGARLPASVAAAWRAQAAASGLSVSDWLRRAVDPRRAPLTGLRTPGRRLARRQADPALVEAVGRLGNNVNQVARICNRGALAGRPADAVEVLRVLSLIERHLRELTQPAES